MKEQNYVIFTDTDTDITPQVAEEYGYKLISMPYTIDGKIIYPYVDFKTFNADEAHEFYNQLRSGTMPTTQGLSPANYEEYFEPVLKSGKDILYVHFSKAMSGTFNAMNIAIKNLKEKYPNQSIYTLDTKAITILSYNIVREVGQMYLDGKSVEEILEWGRTEVDQFAIFLFADNLSFFKRSGRVKAFSAFMGNLLGIRPIITMNTQGEMVPVSKARGLNGAIDKLIEYVVQLQYNIKDHRVIVGHTDNLIIAKQVGQKLIDKFGDDLNIEYVLVNPTAGSHCGPDGIGVCFHSIHR